MKPIVNKPPRWEARYPSVRARVRGAVGCGGSEMSVTAIRAPGSYYLRRSSSSREWLRTSKFDPAGAALADRHYSRRTPGSPQFMPPGQTVVMVSPQLSAVFGWWRPHPASGICSMNGLDGWTCTIFRNESRVLSSYLILEAEAVLASAHDCGPDGMLTYVDMRRVRSANPGFCFQRAGWMKIGYSADQRKRLLHKPFGRAGVEPDE